MCQEDCCAGSECPSGLYHLWGKLWRSTSPKGVIFSPISTVFKSTKKPLQTHTTVLQIQRWPLEMPTPTSVNGPVLKNVPVAVAVAEESTVVLTCLCRLLFRRERWWVHFSLTMMGTGTQPDVYRHMHTDAIYYIGRQPPVCMHVSTHTHLNTHTQLRTNNTHTHTHTQTHTHTHTHKHTHK